MCLYIFFEMQIYLTWLEVVGVTALLSGVLARAKAVASSLCVIGRGPVAPLWLRDTGRIPAEAPALLEGPAGLPCYTHSDTGKETFRPLASSDFLCMISDVE